MLRTTGWIFLLGSLLGATGEILAGLFLGESLGLFHIVGGGLILAGLLLATRVKRPVFRRAED